MPTMKDQAILEAALIGIESRKQILDQKAAEIRRMLSGDHSSATRATSEAFPRKRRKLSAGARKRIATAQKARWAKFNAEAQPPTATTAPTKPKRKLSTAAKAKLVANLRKARAAKAAKAAAGKKTSTAKKAAA